MCIYGTALSYPMVWRVISSPGGLGHQRIGTRPVASLEAALLPNVFLAIFQKSGYNNIIIANRSAL